MREYIYIKNKVLVIHSKTYFYRVTQSRSFQMLQGWISDSEKTVPTAVPPPSQSQPQPQSSASSSSSATTSAAAAAAAAAAASKSAGLSLTFFFDYHH